MEAVVPLNCLGCLSPLLGNRGDPAVLSSPPRVFGSTSSCRETPLFLVSLEFQKCFCSLRRYLLFYPIVTLFPLNSRNSSLASSSLTCQQIQSKSFRTFVASSGAFLLPLDPFTFCIILTSLAGQVFP